MYCAFGKKKGKAPGQIAVRCPTGPDQLFSEQEEVERAGANHLTGCYTSTRSSPFASGHLLDDIGRCVQEPADQCILNGTYEFTPEFSTEVKHLCMETAAIFSKTADSTITTFITRSDFQTWWLTSNEAIQSSKSRAHFGHYKAAAENNYLSTLHVARLNSTLETGIPYKSWIHGHRPCDICLVEANFN